MRFMKAASPILLPLLRSRSQGDILATIMLDPDNERSLSEIAEATGVSVATVQREVARLEEAGLVTTTRRGNTRLVRAVTDSVSTNRWPISSP
jgi:DNA-binding MarR family transcriptional regulator